MVALITDFWLKRDSLSRKTIIKEMIKTKRLQRFDIKNTEN